MKSTLIAILFAISLIKDCGNNKESDGWEAEFERIGVVSKYDEQKSLVTLGSVGSKDNQITFTVSYEMENGIEYKDVHVDLKKPMRVSEFRETILEGSKALFKENQVQIE